MREARQGISTGGPIDYYQTQAVLPILSYHHSCSEATIATAR